MNKMNKTDKTNNCQKQRKKSLKLILIKNLIKKRWIKKDRNSTKKEDFRGRILLQQIKK